MVRAHSTVVALGALLLSSLALRASPAAIAAALPPAMPAAQAALPPGTLVPVTVPFNVEWTGNATRQLNPDTQESDIKIDLTAKDAPLGLTSLKVDKFLSVQTLAIPRGTYTFYAANGDRLDTVTIGQARRGDNDRVFSDETLTVMGGTGKFMGATGSIRALSTGTARRTATGVDTMTDDVIKHMNGTVTLLESTGSLVPGCATEFTAGFSGKPASLLPLDDGTFAVAELNDRLAIFNPQTLAVSEYSLPPGTNLHEIARGPDGAIWFTALSDQIGRWDPKSGQITLLRNRVTPGSYPHVILAGPDGNIWFSEQGEEGPPLPTPPGPHAHTALAQLDLKSDVVTEYWAGLPPGNLIHTVIVGPDGNFWATLEGLQQIARFNLATKTFDKFVQFPPGSGPHYLMAGPDGNIYVALSDSNQVARVDPKTGAVHVFSSSAGPTPMPSMLSFTLGSDQRSIWFTLFQDGRIGRLDLVTNQIAEFDCGIRPGSNPLDIVVGPDKNLWFTEAAQVPDPTLPGAIVRFVPPAGP